MVGMAVTVVAAWGSSVSIRSAARGPRWALDHLAGIRPWVIGGILAGLALTAGLRPLWVGLVVLYLALTVAFLGAMLRRALARLEEAGGLDELPLERRREIVGRARRTIAVAGVVIAAVGVGAMLSGAGPVGWVPALLGSALVVTALGLSADTG